MSHCTVFKNETFQNFPVFLKAPHIACSVPRKTHQVNLSKLCKEKKEPRLRLISSNLALRGSWDRLAV